MLGKPCKENIWIVDGFTLLFQIVFIFAFLTIFFFVYVVNVEREGFKTQMTYIVDELFDDNFFKNILDTKAAKKLSTDELITVISGIIDDIEFNANKSSQSGVRSVNKNNENVRVKAFKLLGIVIACVVILSIIIIILGYCLPIFHQIKEAAWVTLFVGITEFAFLQLIAKKYISADPNKVRRAIGQALQDASVSKKP